MTRAEKPIRLSARLTALAEMVPEGRTIADVGCDHGFLDIYLAQMGKIPHALAMDVRKGPLTAAIEHIHEYGLEHMIEARLSDGLEKYLPGEAKVLVCAGMGGPLMQRILTAYPEKTEDFEEMILQPQSEIKEFRVFLRENGYRIMEERILTDEGKYYFPMKVCKGRETEQGKASDEGEWQEVFDRYGAELIRKKDPLLKQYLLHQRKTAAAILEGLSTHEWEGDDVSLQVERRMQRFQEVEKEIQLIQKALDRIG